MGKSNENCKDISDFSTTETSSDESVISNKNKKFKCTYTGCFAAFSKNRKFINHIRRHTGERPFVCDTPGCKKQYTNSSHLRRHKKLKHEGALTKVQCTFCHRELANTWSLKKHINRCHNPDRKYPYNCDICKSGFHKKLQLQQHVFVHTGELPFGCDNCDKKFMTLRDCNRHKKVHLTVYPCECGEIFEKWTILLAHKKECNIYECEKCHKKFMSKSNLSEHKETHIELSEREVLFCPYEGCGRFYFYKKNLDYHVKYFHEKAPKLKIPCTQVGCDKLVSNKQNLKIHLKTHEKQDPQVKKKRKPRKDKGIPKKPAVLNLINIETLNELI